jgi:hypothetical protein
MKLFYFFIFIFFFYTIIVLSDELKIQPQRNDYIRIKTKVENSTTKEIANSSVIRQISKVYKTDANIVGKLNFLTSLKNTFFKDGIFQDKFGREIFESGKIYIRLNDKISLDEFDKETGKKSTLNFKIPGLDIISESNKVYKITESFAFSKPINEISAKSDALYFRELLERTYIVYFDKSVDVIALSIEFAKNTLVEYAEPIPCNYSTALPNDPSFSNQFALGLMEAPAAWDIFKGQDSQTEILIGVCDSGVDWDHPDLLGNLKENLGEDDDGDGHVIEFSGGQWQFDTGDINGIDDDGNLLIDDFIGWNFFTTDGYAANNPMATTLNIHGTHVAGICDAVTNNLNGIAGLPWNIKFIPTKHGNNNGGSSIYNGYDGLIYLSEFGADIINCSWGGYFYSQTDQTLINYCSGLGTLIIAAAGNDAVATSHYPSSYFKVISTCSINKDDHLTSYSNFGIVIDVAAYGGETTIDGGILSTVPNNTYSNLQGTSMASPYVTALAAFYKSYKPNSTNTEIIQALLGSSIDLNSLNPNYTGQMGYGKINAKNILTNQNPDISHNIKLDFWSLTFSETNGNGLLENGETANFVLSLRNFNPLYGTNNLNYEFTCSDPNVTIINGSGTKILGADDFLTVDDIQFELNQNCPTKIIKFNVSFSAPNITQNYVSSILVINNNSSQEALGYIAYDPVNGITGPCKFRLNNPSSVTLIQNQSNLDFIKAGTYNNNIWYADDAGNKFISINQIDGTRTQLSSLGVSFNGLAYDFLSRNMYGLNNGDGFYKINLNNYNLTKFYSNSQFNINLAADNTGNMFTIDLGDDSFYKISKYENNPQYMFSFPYDLNYAQDMEYDYNTGILFSTIYTNDNQSIFVAIDQEYGWDFEIGYIQSNFEITGLAFPHTWSYTGVQLQSPEYNQLEILPNHEFTWDNYPVADSYKLIIATNESMTQNVHQFNVNTNSAVLNNVIYNGRRYFWKVIAYDNNIELAQSPIWTFRSVASLYCVPSVGICDEYIALVGFNKISNPSVCGTIDGFEDFTQVSTNIRRGNTYNFLAEIGNFYPEDQLIVFIDWNQNLQFDIGSEDYVMTIDNNTGTFFGQIQVPVNAVLGQTDMRIRLDWNETPPACGFTNWGDIEDYTVNILVPADELTINLNQGWNMVSSNIIPESLPIDVVASDIINDMIIAKNNSGDVFIPQYDINTIGDWDVTQGYQIYMANANSLLIAGTQVNPDVTTIILEQGWNMISYLRNTELDCETAFSGLTDNNNLIIVKDNNGNVYIPSFGINSIGNLIPGQGYQIYVTNADILTYPGN